MFRSCIAAISTITGPLNTPDRVQPELLTWSLLMSVAQPQNLRRNNCPAHKSKQQLNFGALRASPLEPPLFASRFPPDPFRPAFPNARAFSAATAMALGPYSSHKVRAWSWIPALCMASVLLFSTILSQDRAPRTLSFRHLSEDVDYNLAGLRSKRGRDGNWLRITYAGQMLMRWGAL